MSANLIKALVDRFSDHQSEYTPRGHGVRGWGLGAGGWCSESSHTLIPDPKPLNPASNRRDFLDPLFESLGFGVRC